MTELDLDSIKNKNKPSRMPVAENRRCTAIKPNGERCKSNRIGGKTICTFHDMHERRGHTGKTNREIAKKFVEKLDTLPDVSDAIKKALNMCVDGGISPNMLTAISQALRVLLKVKELEFGKEETSRVVNYVTNLKAREE